MKIIPNSDILIEGQHSPANKETDAPDAVALSLIAQGLARRPASKASTAGDESTPESAAKKPATGGKATAAKAAPATA